MTILSRYLIVSLEGRRTHASRQVSQRSPRAIVVQLHEECSAGDSSFPFTVRCRIHQLFEASWAVAHVDIAGFLRCGGTTIQRHAIFCQETGRGVGQVEHPCRALCEAIFLAGVHSKETVANHIIMLS